MTTAVDHPLAALTADELSAAVAVVHQSGRITEAARFAYVGLCEPDKAAVRAFVAGDRVPRSLRLVIVPGPAAEVVEAVVDLETRTLTSWETVPDSRPALLMEESIEAIVAVMDDPRWQAAMRRRGIEDFSRVQIDPWPAGAFALAHEEDRRISRCLSYYRQVPGANGYARPIEGVIVFVDMGRHEVLEVVDHGVVPLPPEAGSYYPEDAGPLRTDLRPLLVHQPEGPSFTVTGNRIDWQRWSMRVSMDPYEGLVLHTVGYEDQGAVRPVLYRAAISEMVVPYGDPGPMHAWKSAFDVGEWGLGRMANSLTLGCDCLGEIHYFDADFADEGGRAHTLGHAICVHEEDAGIGWKHVDLHSGRTEVRRSRRLVVSSIATVGNYEYGFYWSFSLDGTIALEVKLTGILSTMAVEEGTEPAFAGLLAPGLAAPFHQHLFNVRLDVEVDGPDNAVYEVDTGPSVPGPDNPWGNAFAPTETLLATEAGAIRRSAAPLARHWKVVNHHSLNRLGQPVAYKLVPGSSPTLLAEPGSSVGRRAHFASANLWVTPYDRAERRAAGDHPNQHVGGDGLPRWTAADRDLVDTDLVLWHTFGVTHLPRPEDWPVMPVESTGFSFIPHGFFAANPALDVPPTPTEHCHPASEGEMTPGAWRLAADAVVTVDPAGRVLRPGVVDVADGAITYVGSPADAPPPPGPVLDRGGLVMPGLVNTHAHTPMILMRGVGDGLALERWLHQAVWPLEARMDDDDVWWGMTLGAAELLTCGVTTTCEMYLHPRPLADALGAAGLRAVVTPGIFELPGAGPTGSWQHCLDDAGAFFAEAHDPGRGLSVGLGPHAAYTLGPEALAATAAVAAELGALVQIHLAETKDEDARVRAAHGCGAPEALARAGLLDGPLLGAHGIWLDAAERQLLGRHGAAVAHCPQSNGKLGSGMADVVALRAAGVEVGLGTDSPASNDNLDLWEELRLAPLLARALATDPTVLCGPTALTLATAGGARALHLDCGALEVGRPADLIRLDLDDARFEPALDDDQLLAHLVWSSASHLVTDVWVGGRPVVADRRCLTVDVAEARRQVRTRARRITQAAG